MKRKLQKGDTKEKDPQFYKLNLNKMKMNSARGSVPIDS